MASCAPYVQTGPPANTTARPAVTAARVSSGGVSAKITATPAGENRRETTVLYLTVPNDHMHVSNTYDHIIATDT